MVIVGDTNSIDIATDSDYVAHMATMAHTEADTGSHTDWVGTV